jgi:hypothetical protein
LSIIAQKLLPGFLYMLERKRVTLASDWNTSETVKTPLQIQELTPELLAAEAEAEKSASTGLESLLQQFKAHTNFFQKAHQSLTKIQNLPTETLEQVYDKGDKLCGLAKLIQVHEKRFFLQCDTLRKKLKSQQGDFAQVSDLEKIYKDFEYIAENLLTLIGEARGRTLAGTLIKKIPTNPIYIGVMIGKTKIGEMDIDIYARNADYDCFIKSPDSTSRATRLRCFFCHNDTILVDFILYRSYLDGYHYADSLFRGAEAESQDNPQITTRLYLEEPNITFWNATKNICPEQLRFKIYQTAAEIALNENLHKLTIWDNSQAELLLHACGFDLFHQFSKCHPNLLAQIKNDVLQQFQSKREAKESLVIARKDNNQSPYTLETRCMSEPCLYISGVENPLTWHEYLKKHRQLDLVKSKLPRVCGFNSTLPENYPNFISKEKIQTDKIEDLDYLLSMGQAIVPHHSLREASPDIEVSVYREPPKVVTSKSTHYSFMSQLHGQSSSSSEQAPIENLQKQNSPR